MQFVTVNALSLILTPDSASRIVTTPLLYIKETVCPAQNSLDETQAHLTLATILA